VKHHEPRHEGWDRGHKSGFHGQPSPHGQSQKNSYVNHHYDRRGASPPANQQGMNRPPREARVAPVAR
jgi:hypothetical protein